jgi:hypothetical protein
VFPQTKLLYVFIVLSPCKPALPSPGFYPEISGFFEAVGIFLGFLFEKVNLGIFLGFFRKGSSKFRNGYFCKID